MEIPRRRCEEDAVNRALKSISNSLKFAPLANPRRRRNAQIRVIAPRPSPVLLPILPRILSSLEWASMCVTINKNLQKTCGAARSLTAWALRLSNKTNRSPT
eukprot:TRINITY_DN8331_c0_g4_i1.p1 TRINITY_DN8331_c0_g4~~TRINITY_DN8331_c0_g4_i1.p1  ORF type:complete len:109 (+),score=0.59 TRINITY_DN8331_c0_g4_i1:22-327(+)